jgi:hypothetical protein
MPVLLKHIEELDGLLGRVDADEGSYATLRS